MHHNVFLMIVIAMILAAKPAQAFEWGDLLPPNEQAKQRDDKMFTVGMPMSQPYNLPSHFQIRPSPKMTYGAGFAASDYDGEAMGNAIGFDRELQATVATATAYLQVHPLKNSGFYFGAGAEMRSGTYRILRLASDDEFWSAPSVKESEGSYEALYGGPSFGWLWIWDNGLTIGFDMSKRKRFSHEIKVTHRESENINTYQSDVEKWLVPDIIGGTVMIGYSF